MNSCRSHRCNQGRKPCRTPEACQLVTRQGGRKVDTEANPDDETSGGPWDWIDFACITALRAIGALVVLSLLASVLTR